jgi:hypothetical protein
MGFRFRRLLLLHWWIYLSIATAGLLALYGVFRWASAAPEIDAEAGKECFRAEQDWRALRRAGPDAAPPQPAAFKK